jgi:DNA-directed RNA polymerase subunit RPC12/RpoP
VKFLCIDCDEQMRFDERQQPGDGTFAAAFECPRCGRRIAMLANPMETQLVESLGVKIGGRTLEPEPMEIVRGSVVAREGAFVDESPGGAGTRPRFTEASQERLARVPSFVRGMVKRIYTEYAVERGIPEITPDVMDRARTELGLEGM